MSQVRKIPTSKLVFETVFPGHVEVKTRIGVEEEIFLRLTREFKLPPEVVQKFISDEQEKISARGDNLDSYFFNDDKTLDESLRAISSGVGRSVSSAIPLDKFTFSEYSFFQGLTITLWYNYRRRQTLFNKEIKRGSSNIDRMLSRLFGDSDASMEATEREKSELIYRRNRECELVDAYDMLADICLTKSLDYLGTNKGDARAMLRLAKELIRVYKEKTSPVGAELLEYLDIDNDFYQHDTELLNQAGVSGYSFSKKY